MTSQLSLPGMEHLCGPAESVSDRLVSTIASLLNGYAAGKGECWPSRRTLARRAGVCVRQVSRAIAVLVKTGCIAVRRRGIRGVRTSLYLILRPFSMARKVTSKVTSAGPRSTCIEEKRQLKKPMGDGVVSCATEGEQRPEPRPASRTRSAIPSLTRAQIACPITMHRVLVNAIATVCPHKAAAAWDKRTLLNWFGCAARALRVGKNPPGLFRSLWRGKKWGWISTADDERAREWVRKLTGEWERTQTPRMDPADEACIREEDQE